MDRKRKTARMAALALLAALVVVLQTVASGIKIGAVPITLTLVPIVVGAIVLGPRAGAFLGGVFGVVTLVAGIIGADPFTFMLWAASPLWTAVTCLGKGVLCGLVAGLLYRALGERQHTAGSIVASVAAPLVNTGVFALMMLTVLCPSLATLAGGSSLVSHLFLVLIGVNFLVELGVNVVLSTGIAQSVRVVTRQLRL